MTMILVAAVAVLAVALVIALALLMRGPKRAEEDEQFELLHRAYRRRRRHAGACL